MGKVFRYISDGALRTTRVRTCEICKVPDVDTYNAPAEIELPDGSRKEVFNVCADCLRAGRICEHFDDWTTRRVIDQWMQSHFRNLDRQARKVARRRLVSGFQCTPRIPEFINDTDWPFCCGDLAEFIGQPNTQEQCVDFCRTQQFWEAAEEAEWDDRIPLQPPLELYEFNFFACLRCPKRYWVWQTT